MRTGSTLARIFTGAAALLAALAANGLQAQSPDPYADLVDALAPEEQLAEDFRIETEIELPNDLLEDPEVAALERDCPGVTASVIAAVRPATRVFGERFRNSYRAELQTLLEAELAPEEARAAAAFYRSDVGKRMMASRRALREHDNVERSFDSSPQGTVETEALERDQVAAALAGQAALSEADRTAARAEFASTSWGRTITRLRSTITALQARVYNTIVTANGPAVIAAAERGLIAHQLQCE